MAATKISSTWDHYRILVEKRSLKKKKKKRKLTKDTKSNEAQVQKFIPSKKSKDSVQSCSTQEMKNKGRHYTISLALPGSIIENAQSPALRTYLAGQIARALVVFNIDEVIVFNESGNKKDNDGLFKGSTKASDPNILLARILQYLECPQYLRKYLFPRHPDLQFAGVLNPLDSPHHLRIDEELVYREGVVVDRPVGKGGGSFVNAGLRKEVKVDKHLKPGTRVTVKLDQSNSDARFRNGKVVSPSAPRTEGGLYWGYNVRLAQTFGAVFTQCPHKQGYDAMIGTSEKGESVDKLKLASFSHLLIVFGGLHGLEAALESDESLPETDPSLLFDHYVNTCPYQGSRTIRTEEAILITMSALRPKISKAIKKRVKTDNPNS